MNKKNNSDKILTKEKPTNHTFSENQFTLERGWVYWFDPVKKTEIDVSPLVVILSNTIHNRLSDHIIVALVTGKNVGTASNTFEVYCEIEGRKLKVLVSEIHTVPKERFYDQKIYLGKMKKEQREEVNEKLRLILQLNN